jgi:hypothetical protein
MSDVGLRDRRDNPLVQHVEMSPEGRWAMALGVLALLIGLAALVGGAYFGFGTSARLVAMPAGLPAAEAETVGMFLVACGAVTMMLGVVSIYKANDI